VQGTCGPGDATLLRYRHRDAQGTKVHGWAG
jgi:hypothetical protein